MGKYNGAVITTAGQNIIAESISGTLLEWTVMRSSSVAIPAGTNLEALTSLTGIEQSTRITDASVYGNNVLQVSARFPNTGVSTAYLIQTVGIYGQLTGGSETLIAVMTAVTPDEMPVYDPDSPSAFIFNTQVTVTNADSVTMVVNDTGTATVADLNRKVGISGGDVSDTVVNTVVAESAEYPVPAAGDTVKVIIGKIAKFFADIVRPFTGATASANGAKGLVPAPSAGQQTAYMRGDGQWTQPQNNATTTQNGYVLDAKMGKTLQDQITSLNDSLANKLNKNASHRYWENGTAGIQWQSRFKDAVVVVYFGLNPEVRMQFHICEEMCEENYRYLIGGGYKSANDNHFVRIGYSTWGVRLIEWYYNGTNIAINSASPCPLHVYERF